jgi:hypothetical protein
MTMDVIINFARPGKGITRYIEGLIDDDRVRIKTLTCLPPEFSQKWCEEVWWQNGCVPHGFLIGSVVKFLFYQEWFSVMQLLGTRSDHLGYYLDVHSPIQKVAGEYYLTDLFLDLWIAADGKYVELDQDEFEQAFRLGLITPYQYKKANRFYKQLTQKVTNGTFFRRVH